MWIRSATQFLLLQLFRRRNARTIVREGSLQDPLCNDCQSLVARKRTIFWGCFSTISKQGKRRARAECMGRGWSKCSHVHTVAPPSTTRPDSSVAVPSLDQATSVSPRPPSKRTRYPRRDWGPTLVSHSSRSGRSPCKLFSPLIAWPRRGTPKGRSPCCSKGMNRLLQVELWANLTA